MGHNGVIVYMKSGAVFGFRNPDHRSDWSRDLEHKLKPIGEDGFCTLYYSANGRDEVIHLKGNDIMGFREVKEERFKADFILDRWDRSGDPFLVGLELPEEKGGGSDGE